MPSSQAYPGLPVRVRVDALPGKIFMGKVSRISPLPDAQSAFMNPDLKLYNTIVDIEGGAEVLKSGMTCEAEVIIDQYEKAIYVPVQCVVQISGKPVAYVRTPAGVMRREVEIGLDNNRMVRVLKGLSVGEEVLVTPPLDSSVSLRAAEQMVDVKIPTRDQAEAEAARQAETRRREGGQGEEEGGMRRFKPTPEQMRQFRERLEKMSPEERQAFEQRMRQHRQSGGPPQGMRPDGGQGGPPAGNPPLMGK